MSLDGEIRALQQGNNDGWQKIVDHYCEQIFAFLSRFTQDRWELEDISQEVWLRVYTKISLYDFRYPFYTWLLKVTTNVAINYKRKRRWWERLSGEDVPQKKSLDYCEFLDEIHKPLSLLSKRARVIFLLYHYESYSAREIADILDIPIGTVKSSLSRSAKLLQNFFGGRT